jgi:hypothetical protein
VRDPSFPVDLIWEEPSCVAMLERLGGFARTIWMDARAAGSSDALNRSVCPSAGVCTE